MTHPIKLLVATVALLTLAACSATNVGESWQCPLAQGPGCSTVAEADPALPRETLEAEPAPGEPLYRPRDAGDAERAAGRSCGGDCGGGFDPFAWLAGMFGKIAGDGNAPSPDRTGMAPEEDVAAATAVPALAGTWEDAPTVPAQEDTAAGMAARDAPAAPAAAGGRAGPDTPIAATAGNAAPLPGGTVAADAALREPEVIGRIWIAPFVDADGHYREGAWVRTVLEPAGWRAP